MSGPERHVVLVEYPPGPVEMGVFRCYDGAGRELLAVPVRLGDPVRTHADGVDFRFVAEAVLPEGGVVARQTYTNPVGVTSELPLDPCFAGRFLEAGSLIRSEGVLRVWQEVG